MKSSAAMLDDAHLLAQINEGCQILMANYNHSHFPDAKIGHLNHPVTKFYSETEPKDELISYMSDLLQEYSFRFGKIHQNYFWLEGFTENIFYNPVDCFDYSKTFIKDHFSNDIKEIRNYIITKPHVRKLKWTRRYRPEWWIGE